MALDSAPTSDLPGPLAGPPSDPVGPVPHGPTGAHRGAEAQYYFGTARTCLRLSLIAAPDLVLGAEVEELPVR